jgi:uncharacterized protein
MRALLGKPAVAHVRRLGILLLAVVGLVACAREAVAIPSDDLLNSLHATADVNDFAGILSPAEKAAIEARCRELRERTGSQLAVVTLKSLEGGSLEDFSFKLAEKWGIHQRGQKNGLLLLVAMAEHKSRIEVGYDLEPIIPDVLAGRILDQQLKPQFRAGQYGAGLLAATNEIVDRVEKGVPADRAALHAARDNSSGDPFVAVLFLCLFVGVGGLILGAGLEQKMAPAVMFGSVFSGGPMLMGWVIAGLLGPAIHLPLALLAMAVGWHLAEQQPPTKRNARSSSPGFGGWNWGNIGTSSGGWSSGGGGFSGDWGGFGGGGGGFGGGGASGGW